MIKIFYFCIFSLFSNSLMALALNDEELAYFKTFFHSIQLQSFANNAEYCGYIGYNEQDQFIATEAHKGSADGCLPDEPPEGFDLVGSYHTHGAFSEDADSELPSFEDMQADIAEDVDGFIATPGGRLWHIDTVENVARQVCGKNCVVADPNFDGSLLTPVEKTYTLIQLKNREDIDFFNLSNALSAAFEIKSCAQFASYPVIKLPNLSLYVSFMMRELNVEVY